MKSHEECFACGSKNHDGLRLEFKSAGNDHVRAETVIHERFRGYPNVVQGGIVAAILDSAMTNCLFENGVEAMTARLNIMYHSPVNTEEPISVEAELTSKRGKVYELKASIRQTNSIRASATAKFLPLQS